MRPINLSMQAFGSYAERTDIDFTIPNQNCRRKFLNRGLFSCPQTIQG